MNKFTPRELATTAEAIAELRERDTALKAKGVCRDDRHKHLRDYIQTAYPHRADIRIAYLHEFEYVTYRGGKR